MVHFLDLRKLMKLLCLKVQQHLSQMAAEKGTTWIRPGQEVRINGWDQWVISPTYK